VIGFDTPDNLIKHGSDQVKQFMTGEADGPVPFHFPAADLAEDILRGNSGA